RGRDREDRHPPDEIGGEGGGEEGREGGPEVGGAGRRRGRGHAERGFDGALSRWVLAKARAFATAATLPLVPAGTISSGQRPPALGGRFSPARAGAGLSGFRTATVSG